MDNQTPSQSIDDASQLLLRLRQLLTDAQINELIDKMEIVSCWGYGEAGISWVNYHPDIAFCRGGTKLGI